MQREPTEYVRALVESWPPIPPDRLEQVVTILRGSPIYGPAERPALPTRRASRGDHV